MSKETELQEKVKTSVAQLAAGGSPPDANAIATLSGISIVRLRPILTAMTRANILTRELAPFTQKRTMKDGTVKDVVRKSNHYKVALSPTE